MSTPLKVSTCTQPNFIDVLSPCDERFRTVSESPHFRNVFSNFTPHSDSLIGLRRWQSAIFSVSPLPLKLDATVQQKHVKKNKFLNFFLLLVDFKPLTKEAAIAALIQAAVAHVEKMMNSEPKFVNV
jgi:hypothetical protein